MSSTISKQTDSRTFYGVVHYDATHTHTKKKHLKFTKVEDNLLHLHIYVNNDGHFMALNFGIILEEKFS